MRIENKIAISILVILVGFPCFVFASASANYENSSETVSAAGGKSSSANVSTFGTVGEVVTGTSESTNYQSSAGFVSTVPDAAPPTPTGDVNNDGTVDITDVILCLRQAIGLDTPSLITSDVNSDGAVDITDVILILRKAIGLDTKTRR